MKNKDFAKFTKRNVHKRRSKEAARRELLRAVSEVNSEYMGVKIKDTYDGGYSARTRSITSRDDVKVRGIFSSSRSGFGFVCLEGGGDDIFIPENKTLGAIDGDYVEAVYHSFKNRFGEEKTEGRVTKIIEYGRKTVIGTVEEERVRHGRRSYRYFVLQPDDKKLAARFYIRDSLSARVGEKVEARIIRDSSSTTDCDVIRVFGESESKEANYAAILAECEIVTEFTPEELKEADTLSKQSISDEGRVRRDSEIIFTMDGEGAKDLDDAVSLRRLPGGKWRLGVHIADVSHYVTERTPLDRCVMARGNSVYFTDKVVPMLPPALSNGACSLGAGEEKYTISALIDLDTEGNITGVKLEPSIIVSRVRGVYSEVNLLLSGDATAEIKKKYSAVLPTLMKMHTLYEILLEKSKKRGAIDFDAPEAEILLDSDGYPVEIARRERGVAERMIEQFMLTANEAVATLLHERGIPCVYRIHEPPPPDKLSEFVDYVHNLGFDTSVIRKDNVTSKTLAALLRSADERGLLNSVSYSMLRAMSKAKYSEHVTPHFGLGIEYYCHFTSPIRRLSDLATHRIIRRVLFEGKRPEAYAGYSRRAAAAATEGELRALSAERRIENLYKVIYMSDYVGESFEATISSVTPYGLFCELENTCEGLIPISELPGAFTYDEKNITIRSKDVVYHLSDRITVRLEEADMIRGKLRFSLVE